MKVPVLMYHGIHDTPDEEGCFDPVYSITRRQFEQQMRWLDENGYETLLYAELDTPRSGKNSVVITFDDGDVSNYTVSLPVLQQLGMTAEYFITTDWIGTACYMNAEQLRALHRAGMALQSHAKSHRYLNDLAEKDLEDELIGSKRRLEQIIGRPVTGLALPGGRGGVKVLQIARESGYRYVCNSELGINTAHSDPFSLKRIAITRQMSLEQFRRLVTGNRWEIGRRLLRQRMLDGMKRVLGNTLYERVRSRFLDG